MGSDQTQVMRKHKDQIPPHLDSCCLSIIGKNRTLDLMHKENQQIAKLWESKIKQLIEADSRVKLRNSPESPMLRDYEEFELHERD